MGLIQLPPYSQKPTGFWEPDPHDPINQGLVLWAAPTEADGNPGVVYTERSLYHRELTYTNGGPTIIGNERMGRVWSSDGVDDGLTIPTLTFTGDFGFSGWYY